MSRIISPCYQWQLLECVIADAAGCSSAVLICRRWHNVQAVLRGGQAGAWRGWCLDPKRRGEVERRGKVWVIRRVYPYHDGAVQSVECPVGCSMLLLQGILHAGAGECFPRQTYARSDSFRLTFDSLVHASNVFGSSAVLVMSARLVVGRLVISHSVQHWSVRRTVWKQCAEEERRLGVCLIERKMNVCVRCMRIRATNWRAHWREAQSIPWYQLHSWSKSGPKLETQYLTLFLEKTTPKMCFVRALYSVVKVFPCFWLRLERKGCGVGLRTKH